MNGNYERNLKALGAKNPALAQTLAQMPSGAPLEIVVGKSGQPVPKRDGVFIHSAYHPEKEAELFIQPDGGKAGTLAVFGFGFGYHLARAGELADQVYVIEPSLDVLRSAFEHRDLSAVLERVTPVTPDQFRELAKTLDYKNAAWLDLEPVARMFAKERQLLHEPFYSRAVNAHRRYKVMVVGPVYGGSVPTAVSCVRGLRELGFDVDFVDHTPKAGELFGIDEVTGNASHRQTLKAMFNNYLAERVAARADFWKPDFILVMAQAPLAPAGIEKLKALGIPVMFWFVENYRVIPYWRLVAPHYDYFFTLQKGEFLDMVTQAGAPFAKYIPQAADPYVHKPAPLSPEEAAQYGAQVSFMGAGYPNRQGFFAGLLDLPLKIWGTEWNLSTPLGARVQNANRRMTPEEYVKIFRGTQINLNLHSSISNTGIDAIRDFVNPRVYEICACGAFQLVDERDELPEMFETGKELITFSSQEDLREKIAYYLAHPEERHAVATAGMRRVLREHTFENRLASMMAAVIPREEARIENARAALRGKNDVDSIIARSKSPGLKEFLAPLAGQGNLSLKKVMGSIARGEGALSRPEALFVIIDQIASQG
ncbi:MAG: glycosyltransferase [Nitrospinae bacterium]|nr:glycosyltransferase [Nitrospinota bacterium]